MPAADDRQLLNFRAAINEAVKTHFATTAPHYLAVSRDGENDENTGTFVTCSFEPGEARIDILSPQHEYKAFDGVLIFSIFTNAEDEDYSSAIGNIKNMHQQAEATVLAGLLDKYPGINDALPYHELTRAPRFLGSLFQEEANNMIFETEMSFEISFVIKDDAWPL